MRRKIRIAPWASLGALRHLLFGVTACGDDSTAAAPATTSARARRDHRRRGAPRPPDGERLGEAVKIGFITKFPVDFYDTMVDAAKAWNKDHPEVELIFAQGESGTDDEGEIAAIESMVTQGVKAIAITPTSPNVQDALQKAVDEGIKVVLVDNDIPDWDGKSRSSPPTTSPAASSPASSWPSSLGRATRSPSSKACPAHRRSTTG